MEHQPNRPLDQFQPFDSNDGSAYSGYSHEDQSASDESRSLRGSGGDAELAAPLFSHYADDASENDRHEEEPHDQPPQASGPTIFPEKGKKFIEKPVPRATWKRLRAAQKAIDHVNNKVMPYGSGNQVDDVAKSQGVAQARAFQTVNKQSGDYYLEKDATDKDVGRTAAQQSILANKYHAGVCDTYSYATFNHLRKGAKGEQITRAGSDCGDHGGHAFNVIGDIQNEPANQLVVADPWATAPQPVLYEDFFLGGDDKDSIREKESMKADGVDGVKKYKDTVQFNNKKGKAKDIAADPDALDNIPQGIKDEQYRNTSTVHPKYAAPIFYYNQNWNKKKIAQKRKEFAKQLESNKHLGPKAMKRLGLKDKATDNDNNNNDNDIGNNNNEEI